MYINSCIFTWPEYILDKKSSYSIEDASASKVHTLLGSFYCFPGRFYWNNYFIIFWVWYDAKFKNIKFNSLSNSVVNVQHFDPFKTCTWLKNNTHTQFLLLSPQIKRIYCLPLSFHELGGFTFTINPMIAAALAWFTWSHRSFKAWEWSKGIDWYSINAMVEFSKQKNW